MFWVFDCKVDSGSSKLGPYTGGCDGKIIGGDLGEVSYGSKLNIPSGVP